MIKKYNISDLPTGLYNRTYDIFSFELISGNPIHLYLRDAIDGEYIVITGLEEITLHRSKLRDVALLRGLEIHQIYSLAYGTKSKKQLLKEQKEMYEKEKIETSRSYTARDFEVFLQSIRVAYDVVMEPDFKFVEEYYGIQIKITKEN